MHGEIGNIFLARQPLLKFLSGTGTNYLQQKWKESKLLACSWVEKSMWKKQECFKLLLRQRPCLFKDSLNAPNNFSKSFPKPNSLATEAVPAAAVSLALGCGRERRGPMVWIQVSRTSLVHSLIAASLSQQRAEAGREGWHGQVDR